MKPMHANSVVKEDMKPLDPSRWITASEAAKLSGFSRPFIERLRAAADDKGEIRHAADRKRREV